MAKAETLVSRVQAALATEPLSRGELCRRLGASSSAIATAVNWLRQCDVVAEGRDGADELRVVWLTGRDNRRRPMPRRQVETAGRGRRR